MPDSDRIKKLGLVRDALLEVFRTSTDANVQKFQNSLSDSCNEWIERPSTWLSASEHLSDAIQDTTNPYLPILTLFHKHRHLFHWEQSYTKHDTAVSDALLDGYGFVELIGKLGPWSSDKARAGLGIWGPNVDYPPHRHKAEEIYMVISGRAQFKVGDADARTCGAGDIVYVKSNSIHGFHTEDQNLILLYIWQAGDLREKSTFT